MNDTLAPEAPAVDIPGPEIKDAEGHVIPPIQPVTPTEPPQDPPQTATDTAEPQQPQDPPPPPAPILETAFVVYLNPQGHWMVAADIHTAAEMQIARPPNVDDFFNGCSTVLRDIHVQETAATAVAMQQQALQNMAENARQQALNQQIASALGPQGGNPGGAIDLSKLGKR